MPFQKSSTYTLEEPQPNHRDNILGYVVSSISGGDKGFSLNIAYHCF